MCSIPNIVIIANHATSEFLYFGLITLSVMAYSSETVSTVSTTLSSLSPIPEFKTHCYMKVNEKGEQ